ncbi:MAG: hypothetical protein U0821_18610 [Chloroflexota bacterium]
MTTLFVERDRRMIEVIRRIRGSCERSEWENPHHRDAAIHRVWEVARKRLGAQGYEFVCALPLILELTQWPDLRETDRWEGTAQPLVRRPDRIYWNTTYLHYAEGPLPHLDYSPAPPPPEDPVLVAAAANNRALADRIARAAGPARDAPLARTVLPSDLVDFRVKGVFRCADFRVLVSRQTNEDAKLMLSDGGVEDSFDEAAAQRKEQSTDGN